MNQALKAGVVGVGKLGRFHCEKYCFLKEEFPSLEFVGVYDRDFSLAQKVAWELSQKYEKSIVAFSEIEEFLSLLDVVTVATPSSTHFELVHSCLNQNLSVLVEKPLALEFTQGQLLVDLAKKKNLVLSVGHSERLNPAYGYIKEHLKGSIKAIQFLRHSPFASRVTDVSVVDDLMIHDLDLLSDLCGQDFEVIFAQGLSVKSSRMDLCDVSMKVSTVTSTVTSAKTSRTEAITDSSESKIPLGLAYTLDPQACISLSSYRVLPTMTRTIRIITDQMSLVADLQTQEVYRDQAFPEGKISLPKQDHLLLETRGFLQQVCLQTPTLTAAAATATPASAVAKDFISAESVLPSVRWAEEIKKKILTGL
jgi:predicted dehydrogenase